MITRSLKILAAAWICVASVQAQISATLSLTKRQHIAGEPVIAVVTITNHAGRELLFQSDGRFQWLDFVVKTANGSALNSKGRTLFGPMKIAAGQTLARDVDLSEHFQLSESGNYTAYAIIHSPGDTMEGTSTNKAYFSQSTGLLNWSQKIGVSGASGNTREYRLLNFAGDSKSQIYAQIIDGRTGQMVRTFLLGDVLMLRKPLATVDKAQRMHVMFLATPTMWVHCVINADGKLVSRQIHQRGPVGDPQLLTFGDGSVKVANSIPYDPKAAAAARAKVRKASDRPNATY